MKAEYLKAHNAKIHNKAQEHKKSKKKKKTKKTRNVQALQETKFLNTISGKKRSTKS